MGHKISKEQIDPGVKDHIMSFVGDISELETEVNTDIISAVNSLMVDRVDNAENMGKLANAIGEPVTANHSVDEVVEGLGEMLSTFKTNMMNSGVMVESSDKFKSLIDKIQGLTEGEGNKGIQLKTGELSAINGTGNYYADILAENIGFIPFIFIGYVCSSSNSSNRKDDYFVYIPEFRSDVTMYSYQKNGSNPNADRFNINISDSELKILSATIWPNVITTQYYAIGLGEEDTTLRDSLASILEEEGVEVTEDDDMASLITKVDEEFDENRNKLYNLMLEGGYDVNSSMNIDSLLEMLSLSGISTGDIKQVACGYYHTVVLKNDGTVWVCGYNNKGQLGLGDTTDRSSFVQVPNLSSVQQVSCGYYHTFAIIDTNTVYATGANDYGQLGLADSLYRYSFTKVTTNVTNVKKIVCGEGHSVMVRTGGGLYCCGKDDKGQCAGQGGNTFKRVSENINYEANDAICGPNFTFVIKYDGSLWACGANDVQQLGLSGTDYKTKFNQVTQNIPTNIKQISCGVYHTMILTDDGRLWACGTNGSGQIGSGFNTTGSNTGTSTFVQIDDTIDYVSCGYTYTFIIKKDGSLWFTGSDYTSGVSGLNLDTSRTSTINGFTQVTNNLNNDVKEVICHGAQEHVFIIKKDGTLWSCGLNDKGQLGIGSTTNKNIFTAIPKGF